MLTWYLTQRSTAAQGVRGKCACYLLNEPPSAISPAECKKPEGARLVIALGFLPVGNKAIMTSEHAASLSHIAGQWAEVAVVSYNLRLLCVTTSARQVMVSAPAGPLPSSLATRHPERVPFAYHNYLFALGTATVCRPSWELDPLSPAKDAWKWFKVFFLSAGESSPLWGEAARPSEEALPDGAGVSAPQSPSLPGAPRQELLPASLGNKRGLNISWMIAGVTCVESFGISPAVTH